MITLRQLQCLNEVAQTQHFRKAAERLGMSQPALSAQIAQLEDNLGCLLLERSRRKVMITPIGSEVAERAKRILAEITELQAAATGWRQPLTGTLKVGVLRTLGPYLLPHFLAEVRRDFPELKLYLREEPRRQLLAELINGDLDMALMAGAPTDDRHLTVQHLFQEPLWAALPLDHPLSAKDSLLPQDLKQQRLIMLEMGDGLREPAMELCRISGASEHPDFRATSLDALRQMVATGLGLTLLPGLYVEAEALADSQIAVRPFRHGAPTRTIDLVWRRTTARAEEFRLLKNLIEANLPTSVLRL